MAIDPKKVCLYVPAELKKFKLDLFNRIGDKIEKAGGKTVRGDWQAIGQIAGRHYPHYWWGAVSTVNTQLMVCPQTKLDLLGPGIRSQSICYVVATRREWWLLPMAPEYRFRCRRYATFHPIDGMQ